MTKKIEKALLGASLKHRNQSKNLSSISHSLLKDQPEAAMVYRKIAKSLKRSSRKHRRQALRLSTLRSLRARHYTKKGPQKKTSLKKKKRKHSSKKKKKKNKMIF